jgi:hypothetical protein
VAPPLTFSERIAIRRRLWWDPPWPGRGRTLADAFHRLHERRVFRSREEADEAWRCCERWPRTLLNKWNSREFAARHGAPVPDLYWFGADHSRAPLDSPRERFVIRPVWGAGIHGTVVVIDGRERLWGGPASPAELRRRLPRSSRLRRPIPILIEEFVPPHEERYTLPLECKCHTFSGEVGAVEVIERTSAQDSKHRYYSPGWEPIPDPINTYLPPDEEVKEPPPDLVRMLELAAKLGRELGTYMRIDFFVGPRGCVFNEFSSVPLMGKHNTPYCDRHFGGLWGKHAPDRT